MFPNMTRMDYDWCISLESILKLVVGYTIVGVSYLSNKLQMLMSIRIHFINVQKQVQTLLILLWGPASMQRLSLDLIRLSLPCMHI